jgi:hypothetical protein
VLPEALVLVTDGAILADEELAEAVHQLPLQDPPVSHTGTYVHVYIRYVRVDI